MSNPIEAYRRMAQWVTTKRLMFTGEILLEAYSSCYLDASIALMCEAALGSTAEASIEMLGHLARALATEQVALSSVGAVTADAHLAIALAAKMGVDGIGNISIGAHAVLSHAAEGAVYIAVARMSAIAHDVLSHAANGAQIDAITAYSAIAQAVLSLAAIPSGESDGIGETALVAHDAQAIVAQLEQLSAVGSFIAGADMTYTLDAAATFDSNVLFSFSASAELARMLTAESTIALVLASDITVAAAIVDMINAGGTIDGALLFSTSATAEIISMLEAVIAGVDGVAGFEGLAEPMLVLSAITSLNALASAEMGATLKRHAYIADFDGTAISEYSGVSIADMAYIEI